VVTNADTTAAIHDKYGGKIGALKEDTIQKYISEHNKGKKYLKAVENFKRSLAGYSVFTYLLGIGDRHSDNIMVTK
jgi:phosphatidylinositol-4,5-bisphosphate 3-kinase catalytic subunit alpha/beta/delta